MILNLIRISSHFVSLWWLKFDYNLIYVVGTWAKAKDKEIKVKKLESKRERMIKHMHKVRKQEMADKGFKSWLKMSLMKAKQVSSFDYQLPKL